MLITLFSFFLKKKHRLYKCNKIRLYYLLVYVDSKKLCRFVCLNLGSARRVGCTVNCSIDVGDSGLGWSGLEAGQ